VALEKDPPGRLKKIPVSPPHGPRRGGVIFVKIKRGQLPSPQKFLVERHARNEEADAESRAIISSVTFFIKRAEEKTISAITQTSSRRDNCPKLPALKLGGTVAAVGFPDIGLPDFLTTKYTNYTKIKIPITASRPLRR
jgi:hypothetical protein